VKQVKLSVIVVSWNVREDLVRCLDSVEKNPPDEQFEIIVVDNASTDGSVDAIRHSFPQVYVIANKDNRGFAAANNQGIEKSQGYYVLFLNPDTIVHPDSLNTLTKFMDSNQDVGACGPKLINTDGAVHASVGYVPTFRSVLYRMTFLRFLGIFRGHYEKLRTAIFDRDKQTDVELLSGAALMVRRATVEEVGLMDEKFFMYYEDADLCLRIKKAGWRIVFVPEAVITHVGGRSAVQISAEKRMFVYSSLAKFMRKHYGKFAAATFNLLFKPGAIIKEIMNVCSGIITLTISILLSNQRRRAKSWAKIRSSALFLTRYSIVFLFKA